jgi:hypothetical protein
MVCLTITDTLNIVAFSVLLLVLWLPLRIIDLFKVSDILFSPTERLLEKMRKKYGVTLSPKQLIAAVDIL